MTQHRYSYVHNNPANLVDECGYNAEWAPQPHNVAIDGLIANVSGGGSMFVNFSQQLAGRVGTRIGGIASGVFDGVVGAGQWAVAHPWESAGIAVAAAAATVAIVMTAPVSVPAILSAAGTIGSNMAIGQGIALAAGVARDAADIVNPSLGTLVGYAQTGVQVFNAVTSLASGVGAIASTNFSDLGAIGTIFTSQEGRDALSAVTGNLSYLSNVAGVEVPGLGLAATLTSYASMAGQLSGDKSQIARAASPERGLPLATAGSGLTAEVGENVSADSISASSVTLVEKVRSGKNEPSFGHIAGELLNRVLKKRTGAALTAA